MRMSRGGKQRVVVEQRGRTLVAIADLQQIAKIHRCICIGFACNRVSNRLCVAIESGRMEQYILGPRLELASACSDVAGGEDIAELSRVQTVCREPFRRVFELNLLLQNTAAMHARWLRHSMQ